MHRRLFTNAKNVTYRNASNNFFQTIERNSAYYFEKWLWRGRRWRRR